MNAVAAPLQHLQIIAEWWDAVAERPYLHTLDLQTTLDTAKACARELLAATMPYSEFSHWIADSAQINERDTGRVLARFSFCPWNDSVEEDPL